MSRVYANIGIGIFWLFAAGLMYWSGDLEPSTLAVFIILAVLFFWSAFKMYVNPQLANKDKKNLIQQITDPNYKNTLKNNKKK